MAGTTRRKLPNIIDDLINYAPQYTFIQAMRILEAKWHSVSYTTNTALCFPANDIATCTIRDDRLIQLELNFSGLCGVDSPLPHYITEPLQKEVNNSEATEKFLNIFNNKIYPFIYQIWQKKYSAQFMYEPYCQSKITSTTQLKYWLEHKLGLPITLQHCATKWLPIYEHTALNGETKLSHNALLGNQLLSSMQQVTITIEAIALPVALQLIDQQTAKLHQPLRETLSPSTSCTIILQITPLVKLNILGHETTQLGIHLWLGTHPQNGCTYKITSS